MKKKVLLNTILTLLILAVIAGGILFAGSLRGWFDKTGSTDDTFVTDLSGSVSVERNGVGFSLNDGSALRDEDILETRQGSYVTVKSGKNSVVLNENTEARIISAQADELELELTSGEIFVVLNDGGSFEGVTVNGQKIISHGTVYSVNVQTGSWNIYVFEGEVETMGKTVEAGSTLNVVGDYPGKGKLTASSLNEFNIENAKAAAASRNICFSVETLDEVIAQREEEKRLAIEQQAAHDAEVIAQGGTVPVQTTTTSTTAGNSASGTAASVKSCTIQIRCDTILDNMDHLTAGKNAYVPASGVILATSTVQFVDGETVFDVLNRVCSYAGIQLEYSWTPMYGSYYIEGINNLYEFDCGYESGWMYKVNGWFPNYGCSSYILKDGDTIVWCYTCNGLGADVGGIVY
ncbi:MAG: DUF4430 domain-containing protein [Eubacteriaceae bacterium]|nr:DUF4430 domain-containing protein [Eubacteriaceae bacterium]